jgi:hypothetical protein
MGTTGTTATPPSLLILWLLGCVDLWLAVAAIEVSSEVSIC